MEPALNPGAQASRLLCRSAGVLARTVAESRPSSGAGVARRRISSVGVSMREFSLRSCGRGRPRSGRAGEDARAPAGGSLL
jgi:hypothetical protein